MKRRGCAYCGRVAQPVHALNCYGCGAPLPNAVREPDVPRAMHGFTAAEIAKMGLLLTDCVEVTTCTSAEREYIVPFFLPRPKGQP